MSGNLPKILTPEQFRQLHATGKLKARGKQPVRGQMNRTEIRYSNHLGLQKLAGEVLWFEFEPMKLRLAKDTFFTPDFGVLAADLSLESHEVKGTTKRTNTAGERVSRAFYNDDAIVKLKIAARLFPWRFFLVYETPSGWVREGF